MTAPKPRRGKLPVYRSEEEWLNDPETIRRMKEAQRDIAAGNYVESIWNEKTKRIVAWQQYRNHKKVGKPRKRL